MAKQVKVTVSGTAGAGKTTVASIIRDALLKAGINVEIEDDEIVGVDLEVRQEALVRAGLEVEIEVVRLQRSGTEFFAVGPGGVMKKIEGDA